MNFKELLLMVFMSMCEVWGFWDVGTTTIDPATWRWDQAMVRNCRFRWQRIETSRLKWLFGSWDWDEIAKRRSLFAVAGLSIDFINLTTAGILNHRTVLSAANPVDPYMHRQRELRIWALGYHGGYNTPWRYRVWRVTRAFPRSQNPEHCHGPLCEHSPRHDIVIVHSYDMMFIHNSYESTRYHYAIKMYYPQKNTTLGAKWVWFAGSGYEYLQHVYENYKIFYTSTHQENIKDCSIYLPKWWGKFICLKETENLAGVQNGGPLVSFDLITGIGAFEIHYNQDRVVTFSDMRYYVDVLFPNIVVYPGEYYEYAYPQWSRYSGFFRWKIAPMIPYHRLTKQKEMWPLG